MKQLIGVFMKDSHLTEETIEINKSIFEQAIALCVKHNCPLFHGGDVFTERKSQSLAVLYAFGEILELLKQNNVYMHIVPGNHDKVDQDSKISYLDPFENHSNITLYKTQTSVPFTNDVFIHFLPYFKENASYVERLELLQPFRRKFNLC